MNKEQKIIYYKKLHEELAKEFNTSTYVINYIRNKIIGEKKTIKEMVSQCLRKKRVATIHKEKWTKRLDFLINNTSDIKKIIERK